MSTILWDTSGTEIVKALAAERRTAGALASGLALTLVVVSDEKNVAQATEAAVPGLAAKVGNAWIERLDRTLERIDRERARPNGDQEE